MKTYQFQAEIIRHKEMDAAYILFPYSVEEEFGTKGQVKVKAVFDEKVEYRGSLANMKLAFHCLGLTKEVRGALGKQPGEFVDVSIQQDNEPRVVEVPSDFAKVLVENELTEAFGKLSYTNQRILAEGIQNAKT